MIKNDVSCDKDCRPLQRESPPEHAAERDPFPDSVMGVVNLGLVKDGFKERPPAPVAAAAP